MSEYYDHSGFPQTNTRASSALMRAELDAVEQGFDKLPVLAGNGGEIVTVKADATGLESKTQVELHLVRDDGDVYTGTHDFTGATITAPTQLTSDSSTKVATTAYVNNVAFNYDLPNQTGNAGKFVTTDGTNASWALPIASQTGNAGKALTTNGTTTSWTAIPSKLKIFETAAASVTGASSMEVLENNNYSTGLTGLSVQRIVYGNNLFVANSSDSAGNVSSSPDGVTWTLRAMPSTAAWFVGTDSTNFVACVRGATTIAVSANGTNWSSGTALPGTAQAGYARPLFVGTTCLVASSTLTSVYRSINNGTSWSTETLPVANGNGSMQVVGGLFVYWTTGTTYYTSATGLTGSWTSRALPATTSQGFAVSMVDFNGSLLWLASANTGEPFYRTSNGVDWTNTGYVYGDMICTINNIPASFGSAFKAANTFHNGKRVVRSSYGTFISFPNADFMVAKGGNVHVLPGGSGDGRILLVDYTASDAATALFM